MKYHVRCHTIWTISALVFNLPVNYRQVRNRIIPSKYQRAMCIQELLGKLPANQVTSKLNYAQTGIYLMYLGAVVGLTGSII